VAWLFLLLIVLVAAPGMGGFGRLLLKRWLVDIDPALATGASFIAGLGLTGTLVYFVGRASVPAGIGLGAVAAIIGWVALAKERPEFKPDRRNVLGTLAACFIPAIGVVVPSTMMDWDSVAYHLAVPQIWLDAGRVSSVSFIHHSNFPFAVDGLNLLGLALGGQAAAKAFQVAYLVFGLIALFGLVREKFGDKAARWACAAFGTIPLVQWESGTAYIDVAHGLYAGLGVVLAIQGLRDPRRMMVGAVLVGLALGSKYTGLQTLFALGIVLLGAAILGKHSLRPIFAGLGIALLVGGPWYLKNAATVGNPVYPFFYEQLGGKNWDQRQADVYRNEQKTFGVPSALPLSVPHAILGMAYQPGRYVNPLQELREVDGKPFGAAGYPIGAAGFAIFLAGLLAAFRRRSDDPDEAPILVWLLLSVLMWSVLSQQSRYALAFAPPLCYLLGSVISRRSWFGPALMGAVAVQGLVTLYACKELLLTPARMRAAFGVVSSEEYLLASMPFYEAAKLMNEDASVKKVGLFDEVFGFYLRKPYFWASYGHTTEMGYETMETSEEFLAACRRLGFSHLYINLRAADPNFQKAIVELVQTGETSVDPATYIADPQARWKGFMIQALAERKLEISAPTKSGLILRVP